MRRLKRMLALLLAAAMAVSLAACGTAVQNSSGENASLQDNAALHLNADKWYYDTEDGLFRLTGVSCCGAGTTVHGVTADVFLPAAYMQTQRKTSGSCSAVPAPSGRVGNYTAAKAPVLFFEVPQDTKQNDGVAGLEKLLAAGCICVRVSLSGENTAPWDAAALKAALRWYRYNSTALPGNTSRFFVTGSGEEGGIAAAVGASGDSALYMPYLKALGAALCDQSGRALSDAVSGVACWSPLTGLDYADAAYEWSMGQYDSAATRADGTWTAALSEDLATAYSDYVNQLGLRDAEGRALKLTRSTRGIDNAGSYYTYLLSVLENALNTFLRNTQFPYTPDSSGSADTLSQALSPSAAVPTPSADETHYDTPQDYIDALNTGTKWILYNKASNSAKIISMEAFVQHCRNAGMDVGAFDDLQRGSEENTRFGTSAGENLHFDAVMYRVLQEKKSSYQTYPDWNAALCDDFAADLRKTDTLGNSVQQRVELTEPLYWLSSFYAGYGKSSVAPFWRIRGGTEQTAAPLTGETNLALVLGRNRAVKHVDFDEVWDQSGPVPESGDAAENLVSWISRSLKST